MVLFAVIGIIVIAKFRSEIKAKEQEQKPQSTGTIFGVGFGVIAIGIILISIAWYYYKWVHKSAANAQFAAIV